MDFYIGVPVTAFFTACMRVKRCLFPVKAQLHRNIKNILCIELSEMGSMILLSPLLQKIKTAYPDANIYFITFRETAPALYLLNAVDKHNILTLRTANFFVFIWDVLCVSLKLYRMNFDITFDLELFSRISSLLTFFSGAPVKTGFDNFLAEGLYRGKFLTHPVTYNPHQHITKNFLSMFYALQENADDIPHTKRAIGNEEVILPFIAYDDQKIGIFKERLYASYPALQSASCLILLNPNSSQVMPLRRWSLESYLGLARKVMDNIPGAAIIVTGAAHEKAEGEFICSNLSHAQVINLAGFTNMEELIALYHVADLLVSNDSGPGHFSALAKVKTIILFGPETPELYGSLNPNAYHFYKHLHCSPCSTAYNQRTSPCRNNVCMQSISVDEVYEKVSEMLQ